MREQQRQSLDVGPQGAFEALWSRKHEGGWGEEAREAGAGRIRVEDLVRILRRSEANEEMKRFERGGAIYSYT